MAQDNSIKTSSEEATVTPTEIPLKDINVLTRAIVRALLPIAVLAFPLYKFIKQFGPPSLYGGADVAVGFLALIIPVTYTFIFWTSLDKQKLRRRMTWTIIVLALSFAIYLILSFAYIFTFDGSRVIGGFVLKPTVIGYISLNPRASMNEIIFDFAGNTQDIWEPWSISVISLSLYASWVLTCITLSMLVGIVTLSLPRHLIRSFFFKIPSHDRELERVIERVEREPEKAKPAWDLARVKLELYFDRNLSQINYIFWLSVLVMAVGFGFILYGIRNAFVSPQSSAITPAVISGLAGVITEFIGATFLFLYRSTIQQAASYTQTLERINSVGMAMQILDSISSESKELKDQTKAEIVKILLLHPSGLTANAETDTGLKAALGTKKN